MSSLHGRSASCVEEQAKAKQTLVILTGQTKRDGVRRRLGARGPGILEWGMGGA